MVRMRRVWLAVVLVCACGAGSCAPRGADLSALQSEQLDVRLHAIGAAGRYRDARAVPCLVDCLQDDQSDVRLFAILALERITGQTMGYCYYAPPGLREQAIRRWRDYLKHEPDPDLMAGLIAEGTP